MNLPDWFILTANVLAGVAIIGLLFLNVWLALRKKYNWAIIIPIAAVPVLLYSLKDLITGAMLGSFRSLSFYFTVYCLVLIISPIICRKKVKKQKEAEQLHAAKKDD